MPLQFSEGSQLKVGDLIKMPGDRGFAIVLKVIVDKPASRANRSVMVMAPWGEDWWDADHCEVVNESR